MSGSEIQAEFALFPVSTTRWKIAEYQAIAENNFPGMIVRGFSDYETFHSAIEDEDTLEKNLAKKQSEAQKKANEIRDNPEPFFAKLKASGIWFKGGDRAAMYRSVVLVDDTTIAFPEDLWNAMHPMLKKLVVPEALKASPWSCPDEPNKSWVSFADIGPALGAIGHKRFWGIVNKAAQNLPQYKNKPVKIYNQISCAFEVLGAVKEAPYGTVSACTPMYVTKVGDDYQPATPIPTAENYTYLSPSNPTKSIGDHYGSFLLNHSTRKVIMDQLCAVLRESKEEIPADAKLVLTPKALYDHGLHDTFATRKRNVVLVGTEDSEAASLRLNDSAYNVRKIFMPNGQQKFMGLNPQEDFTDMVSLDFSFGHADALVFQPFDPSNEKARDLQFMMLRNALVAKALDPRYQHVPLVVMNKDGCYDAALDSHVAYAVSGYNKAFIRHPVLEYAARGNPIVGDPNIQHIPFQHMDVLSGKDGLGSAANDILSFRLNGYHRVLPVAPRKSTSGGKEREKEFFTATVFASASSDKLLDHENARAIGEFLAKQCIGICTGGGNQHLMFASVEAYNKHRVPEASWFGCASTYDIVEVETMYGKLPTCDRWELHERIGPRMNMLFESPLGISVGGGDGTGQETDLFYLRMKYAQPGSDFANKTLLFVGNDSAMHAEIKSIVGENDFRLLKANPYALADKGVYLVETAKEAEPIIKNAQTMFYENLYRPEAPAKSRITHEGPLPKVA
jgi:predicted Rossmann-fold nucleotide-binding protein